MKLIPRWAHRYWAWQWGYFWTPCPGCGVPFGGHEGRRKRPSAHFDSVWGWSKEQPPQPVQWLICRKCTQAGVGCRSHADAGQYHSFDCEFAPAPRS